MRLTDAAGFEGFPVRCRAIAEQRFKLAFSFQAVGVAAVPMKVCVMRSKVSELKKQAFRV